MVTQIVSPTIQSQLYNIIWQDIVNGDFVEGEQLKEVELAKRFNVSRSPIRETLRTLVGDGLLVNHPNRGIYVREFTQKFTEDFFEARIMLEARGILGIIENLDDVQEQKLYELREDIQDVLTSHNYDVDVCASIDVDFHNFILTANNNEFLLEMFKKMSAINSMLQNLSLQETERARESQEEHIEIINYILNRDYEGADKVLKGHIDGTKERVSKVFLERKSRKK